LFARRPPMAHSLIRTASLPLTRPMPALDEAALLRRLEQTLIAFLGGVNVGYYLLMWLVTAYEAAMMAGVPILYPAIRSGLIVPEAAQALYETAARGHTYLLPAVVWFLLYQGLPALSR